MKTFFASLLLLLAVVGCAAQDRINTQTTLSQKSIAVRDTFYFTDIVGGRVVITDCYMVHDSANHRIIIHGGSGGTSFGIPIVIDTNQYSSSSEIQWLGTAGRIVADVDRGGSNNLPSLVIEVKDSSGTTNSATVFAGFRALNSTGTKTLSQMSTVANGYIYLSGRRDSSGVFHAYALFTNDSLKWYVNGVNLITLKSDGQYIDSTTASGVTDFAFLGSNSRVVGYIDRGGSYNLPSLKMSVRDSSGAVNSATAYSSISAENSTGLKTLAQVSAVTNGKVFISGRRDSGGTYNTYILAMNDTIICYINGIEKWRITQDGSIQENSLTRGSDSFTTTATADTVTISGASVSDYYFVSPTGATITSNDVLSVTATSTGFIVRRPSSGTSGLPYNWFRRR